MRFLLLLSLTVTLASTARAQERRSDIPLLSVAGNGEARVAPDVATVRIGVVEQEPTAGAAQDAASAVVQKMLARLNELGIQRKNIQTAQLELFPLTNQAPGQEKPRIVGFRAQSTVTARVEDLTLVGKVIDAGVGAGANTLQGVDFSLRDETPARLRALRDAVAEAKRKASAIADALGVRLVRVQDAEEGGVRVIPPVFQGRAMAGAVAEVSTPVEPGQILVTASVTLRYAITEGK